jgi:hypothetical protein
MIVFCPTRTPAVIDTLAEMTAPVSMMMGAPAKPLAHGVVQVDHVGDADAVADPNADHGGDEGVLADGDVVTDRDGGTAVDLDGGAAADGHPVAEHEDGVVVDLDAQVSG